MRSPSRRTIASIALILSVIALVGGLVQIFLLGRTTLGSEVAFVVMIVALAAFVIVDPSWARQIVTGRAVRYGSNSVLMSAAFLGLVIVVNAFVAQHGIQLDLTENREFTLSPRSIQVLSQVRTPVHVLAFFADDDPGRIGVDNLLRAYARNNPLVTYEFVDPEKNPDKAREYGVDAFGATIFELGDRQQRVTMGASEENYTAALLRISQETNKGIYFLTGHEERNINDDSPNGYLAAAQALRRQGYNVERLNLPLDRGVPDGAAVLIVAAPNKPLLPEEEKAISEFVERGGGLFVLGDVKLPPPLMSVLKEWGVELNDDGIIDPDKGLFGNISTPLVTEFEFDPITKGLAGVFFPGARSLALRSVSNDVLLFSLARSSANSWGETNFDDKQVRYDPGQDTKGPLSIVAVVETKTTEIEEMTGGRAKVRLVVVGDSDFAANYNFTRLNNGDLFLNIVNWLAHEEILLDIPPRQERLRRVLLTASDMRIVFYASTIFLPVAVLLVAGVVWWRRR